MLIYICIYIYKWKDRLSKIRVSELCHVYFLVNVQCSVIIESTLEFSYGHIFTLMHSTDPTVQLKATNALATFVYNNPRVQLMLAREYELSFNYFQSFLQNSNEHVRCAAAFQVCSVDKHRL